MSKFELFPNALPIDAKEIGGGESGGSVLPVVTFTMDFQANAITCDKTFEELKSMTTVLPNGPVVTACAVNAHWVNLPLGPNLPPEYSEQHVGALWYSPSDGLISELVHIDCTWMHHTSPREDTSKEVVKDMDFMYSAEYGVSLIQRTSSINISTSEMNAFPMGAG